MNDVAPDRDRSRDQGCMNVTRIPWPGVATARDLSRDALPAWEPTFPEDFLIDEGHMRIVTAALLAGTPADVPLSVQWSHDGQCVTFEAADAAAQGLVTIGRVFKPYGDGTWEVDHVCFGLAEHYRGSGGAKRMMRASVETYDALDVLYIRAYANYLNGGYVWAKLGFAADNPHAIRERLKDVLANEPDDVLYRAAVDVADATTGDELMYALSLLPEGGGKELLEDQQWHAHLNLRDGRHRQRLASIFDE